MILISMKVWGDNGSLFNCKFENNNIHINLSNEILKLYANENNELDRFLMKNILKVFGLFLEVNDFKNTLTDERCGLILNKYAPLGLKKNIILSNENFLIEDIPLYRGLQEHDVQCGYENLGENFIEKYGYDILSKEDTLKLSHEIVDYYLIRIKNFISNFSWESLIKKLVLNYESLLFVRQLNDIKLFPYLKCYSEIHKFTSLKKQENYELDRTAVPLRLLIEIISAEQDNCGNNEISFDELDQLMALSHNLVQWSFYSDFVISDYVDVNFQILKSGRVGVKSNINDFKDSFLFSRTLELIENDNYHFKINEKKIVEDDEINNMGSVFNDEFGLSLIDFADFIAELINMGLKQNKNLVKIYKMDLIKLLSESLGWENEKSERVIDVFSLKNRDVWENPPIGFKEEEIMPWYTRRRVSYLLKPLIIRNDEFNSIYYGIKNVQFASNYLINLIVYGRYRIDENSSTEFKNFLGRMNNIRGEEFNKTILNWIKENTPLSVYGNIPLRDSERDYGDDVLVIDFDKKNVFSIECKDLYFANNPRDMLNEVERFIGNDNHWMKKHKNREKYLKNNINELGEKLNLCLSGFSIYSFFIVPHEIPSPYI